MSLLEEVRKLSHEKNMNADTFAHWNLSDDETRLRDEIKAKLVSLGYVVEYTPSFYDQRDGDSIGAYFTISW